MSLQPLPKTIVVGHTRGPDFATDQDPDFPLPDHLPLAVKFLRIDPLNSPMKARNEVDRPPVSVRLPLIVVFKSTCW